MLNKTKGEKAIQAFLEALGLPTDSEGLKDTPKRVFKGIAEFCKGPINLDEVIGTDFEHVGKNGYSGMVVQSGIPFRMLCEHHLMPATGQAALGYIPNKRVLGLSKLARLVDAVGTERPSLQEYINDRICDLLVERLDPHGVMCVVSAEHGCMACRGINRPGVATTTSSLRGAYVHVPHARSEFFELCKVKAR